jgi:hypothetical protein
MVHGRHLLIAGALATLLGATPSSASAQCAGDCNDDDAVTVDELVTAVSIALGTASIEACDPVDTSGDDAVTVDELVVAVGHALNGCPGDTTPTPTSVTTPTPTATPTPTTLSGDVPPTTLAALEQWLAESHYTRTDRGWHAESGIHASRAPHTATVRTYINQILFDSLREGRTQHPIGAAAVKELYGGGPNVLGWAVEVKTQPDSANGAGWYWYEGAGLSGQGLGICTGCHRGNYNGLISRDFVLTPFPLE